MFSLSLCNLQCCSKKKDKASFKNMENHTLALTLPIFVNLETYTVYTHFIKVYKSQHSKYITYQ